MNTVSLVSRKNSSASRPTHRFWFTWDTLHAFISIVAMINPYLAGATALSRNDGAWDRAFHRISCTQAPGDIHFHRFGTYWTVLWGHYDDGGHIAMVAADDCLWRCDALRKEGSVTWRIKPAQQAEINLK